MIDAEAKRPTADRSTATTAALRVSVHSEIDGTTTDHLFEHCPVRIGRNQLNELVLDHAYISQWHAVLDINPTRPKTEGRLTVQQVGSSNAVVVGTRKLGPNVEVAIAADQEIRLVPFTLRVQEIATSSAVKTPPVPARTIQIGTDQTSGQVALQILDRLSESFADGPIRDPGQLARFGERLEQALDVFLRCFVALQRGQTQFRRALDIRPTSHRSKIERATSATDVAKLVFNPQEDHVEQLEGAFKNMMIHQVALLNGLMAGVKTLLAKLSPSAIADHAARARRSPGPRQLWQAYQQLHHDLAEEDNETFETIFGDQFGRAYAELLGGRGNRKQPAKAGDTQTTQSRQHRAGGKKR